jgi:hypothetical protein
MQWPTTEHMAALKRVLCYIVGTIRYSCFYWGGSGTAKLVGYCDCDHQLHLQQPQHLRCVVLPWLKLGEFAFSQAASGDHVVV